MIEGHKAAGAVTSELGAELARKKAEAYGLGFVTVRNSNHHGTCAYWGLQMAQRDMIAFVASNTPPFLAAPVSKQGGEAIALEKSMREGISVPEDIRNFLCEKANEAGLEVPESLFAVFAEE